MMTKRPLILMAPVRANSDYYGPLYTSSIVNIDQNTDFITQYDGLPVIPDMVKDEETAEELMELADGLFIQGGDDVDPASYGEEVMECCGVYSAERDKSDILLIKAAVKLGKPVLGICRGAQIVSVAYGGTMYQDIKTQVPSAHIHNDYGKNALTDYHRRESHEVKLVEGTPLRELMGEDSIMVNSLHHQAIKTLGEGVKAMGYSDDGFVEAVYLDKEGRYVRAYHWHPEMYVPQTEQAEKIARDFLSECIRRRK